jgi:hypothetical protein
MFAQKLCGIFKIGMWEYFKTYILVLNLKNKVKYYNKK